MLCIACMTVNPAANRFCGSCGAALSGLNRVENEGPWKTQSGWGELKQATVLFADIVSSTEHIAGLDPEQAMQRLQPAVGLMCDAVERFGGTVVRTLGDGVMALFGVPQALEGHARLACEAALTMQDSVSGRLEGIRIRVGLHCGVVASDPASQHGTRGRGAHGMTIHLASRIMDEAAPGGICLSADCKVLIQAHYETRPMGPRVLKGVTLPVELFTLVEPEPGGANPQFEQAELTPMLGRDAELAQLKRALDKAIMKDARVVGINGVAGTGKSRLTHEFAQWCRQQDVPVHQVRVQLYGHATPLLAALELVRGYLFRIMPDDDAIVARSRVAQQLARVGNTSEGDLALLFEFLGLAKPQEPAGQANPKVRHSRLMHIVRELFQLAAEEPSVLIIEDMHWLDEASEEFVAAMVDACVGSRALLILNYRPTYLSPWIGLPHFEQIELTDLNASTALALVRELIGYEPELADVCQMVAERSGGNPFFAEELVVALHDSGALSAAQGSPSERLARIDQALPSSVLSVVGARIDRLEEAQKTLLQTCAIVGKEIPLSVLVQLVGASAAEVELRLESLCRVALMRPQISSEGRIFAFRHPLIQEVAYGMQMKSRRAAVHAAVAAVMESHFKERLDEHAGLIGHHYEVAGQGLQAARYIGRAARWVGASDTAQAIKHWRKIWALLRDAHRSPEADVMRSTAGWQLGVLGWREGVKFDEIKPVIDEAIILAEGHDNRLVQSLMIVSGRMHVSSGGSADEFIGRARGALALTPETDLSRIAMLNALLSQALGWAGLLHEALQTNLVAQQYMDQINAEELAFAGFNVPTWLVAMRGRLLLKIGNVDEAARHLKAWLMSKAGQGPDPMAEFMIHAACLELGLSLNDLELAEHHSAVHEELAGKSSSPYLRVFGLSFAASVNIQRQQYLLAQQSLEQSLALVRSASVAMEFEPELLAMLAECLAHAGRAMDAADYAKQAAVLARVRGTRLAECRAAMTLGKLLLESDGSDPARLEAMRQFARAEELIAETGAQPFNAMLRQARASLNGEGVKQDDVKSSATA